MKTYHIATLPGDGVGREIVPAAAKVLEVLSQLNGGFGLDCQFYDVGTEVYLKTGEAVSESIFKECEAADAILMGSMGMNRPGEFVLDEKGTAVETVGMFKLRFGFDLYTGVRPIRLYPGVPSALYGHDKIDFVIVREQSEGLFASIGGGICLRDEVAMDTQVITRKGSERIHRRAFELARDRKGRLLDGKKLVTCTHKGNNIISFAFFKDIFFEISKEYEGEVEAEHNMIDAFTLLVTQSPESYDVVVAENAHGDIISDMSAAFIGGMGMAPSGDIGEDHAMFQPSHGTAPTIAGKNIVNPTAAILSGKMMLEWLGKRHNDPALFAAANTLDSAVANTFRQGVRTIDVKGNASTSDFTEEVVRQLKLLKQ